MNNGAREMEFGLPDGGEDDEHNGIGLVASSQTFVTQDAFFFGTDPFGRV